MSSTRSSYTNSLNFFGGHAPKALVEEYGSPLYVYNENVLRARCREMRDLVKLPGFQACYSTKANGNPHILRIAREEGLFADAMSPGEVALLRRAGFKRENILYVCNNVSAEELSFAAQHAFLVSVDSLSQLETFGTVNPGASVMVRVNPGIGAGHHEKVVTAGKDTKFGVTPEDFERMREIIARHNLKLAGLNQHVGSLFMEATPYLEAAKWLLETAESFPGVEVVDFGGGFGIPYHKYEQEARLDVEDTGRRFTELLAAWVEKTGYKGRFITEPGRYITAECGLLLGNVYAVKNNGPTRYVGTDLGFAVLIRPAMYDSFHDVEVYAGPGGQRGVMEQTIVGNICETGDIMAKKRMLPEMKEGDVVGILDAGAYGHSMSSDYNQRFRPAEVLIRHNGEVKLIRRRETIEDLLAVFPE